MQDDQNIYVVQDLCCGGDLADLMSVSKSAGVCLPGVSYTRELAMIATLAAGLTHWGGQYNLADCSEAVFATGWLVYMASIFCKALEALHGSAGWWQHKGAVYNVCHASKCLANMSPSCDGDARVFFSQAQEGRVSQQEAATIIRCVLEFLADCHARSVCYGDVKPNNFVLRSLYPSISHLLDPSTPKGLLEVVAVDFGCCQVMDDTCLPDSKVTGTPLYMAPENMRGCHGMEVDVWAAGVMVSMTYMFACCD